MKLVLISLAAVLMLCVVVASAQRMSPPPCDPYSVFSTSKQWELRVDPSSLRGVGKANYEMYCDGWKVWSKEFPVTLHSAVVANDGTAGGFGYTHGIEGYPSDGGVGEFHVVLFDPRGGVKLDDVTKQTPSNVIHDIPFPTGDELVLCEQADVLILRVRLGDANYREENWWRFQLSTGKRLSSIKLPRTESQRYVIATRPVSDTPLVLYQWWQTGGNWPLVLGTQFVVSDTQGNIVWTLDLPDDYDLKDDNARDALMDEIRRDSAIVDCNKPNEFTVRVAKTGEIATYSARPDKDKPQKWEVVEKSRKPFEPAKRQPATLPVFPEITLQKTGELRLGEVDRQPAAIRNIQDIKLDDQGRFGVLRYGEHSFALCDPDGRALTEVALPKPDDNAKQARLGYLGQDRWAVIVSGYGIEEKPTMVVINSAKGTHTEPKQLDCPPVESLDSLGDGRVVAHGRVRFKYTMTDHIFALDESGKVLWDMEGSEFSPNGSCMFQAVSVLSDGRVAALSSQAVFFIKNGKLEKSMPLKDAFGVAPRYVASICGDRKGGMYIHDFGDEGNIYHLDAGGKKLKNYRPAFKDGRKFDIHHQMLCDLDGKLWLQNSDAAMCVDDNGVVTRLIGRSPDSSKLMSVSTVSLDSKGNIYAGSNDGGAIHVFDKQGRPLRVLKPDPSDYRSGSGPVGIEIDAEQNVHAFGGTVNLVYDPAGKRSVQKEAPLDTIRESRLFRENDRGWWAVGYQQVYLLDANGKELRKIERRFDRKWLNTTDDCATGPDGSLVVTSSGFLTGRQPVITLYKPNGDAVRDFPLNDGQSFHRLAFNGNYIAASFSKVLLIRVADGQMWRVAIPSINKNSYCTTMFSPDGKELWVREGESSVFSRYALPE